MATSGSPASAGFVALLSESLGCEDASFKGKYVKGAVTAIENDLAVIDVGLNTEVGVALREFAAPGQKADLKVGDEVEVYVDRVENHQGEAMLSRARARRAAAWHSLVEEFSETARLQAGIFCRVMCGVIVDLNAHVPFVPIRRIQIRHVRTVTPPLPIP